MEIVLEENLAPHVLSKAHLSRGHLNRTIAIIKEFFGESWLEEIKAYYSTREHLLFKHPIYMGLLKGEVSVDTPTVAQIAACLNRLRGKRGIAGIVSNLKNPDSFDDYFYQLVTSYRISFIDPELELEPEIHGKTPDIKFQLHGNPCVIECSIIKEKPIYTRFHEAMEYLFPFFANECQRRQIRRSLNIEALHESIISKREDIQADILRMLNAGTIPATIEHNYCRITLSDIDDEPAHHDLLMARSSADIADVQAFTLHGRPLSTDRDSKFFVTYSQIAPALHRDIKDKIYDKIQAKREQVRPLAQDHEIFLLIDTDVSWDKLNEDENGRNTRDTLLTGNCEPYSMITLTNYPRGVLEPFAVNKITNYYRSPANDWWEDFWRGFYQPCVLHSFPVAADRNDPCPCGIGIKFKKCHGFLPLEPSN